MLFPALASFTFILSCLVMIPHCASLSPDGQILLKIRKGDWKDPNNSLSNWDDSHQNPCAWHGISCDKFNTVTAVDLTGDSISGNLTSAICALPNLTVLTLQDNAFTGPFPLGLLHCKRLRKLDLSLNKFAGMLPAHVSQLSELRVLNLSSNAFSGIIPTSFGMLPKLEALFLHDNSLSGTFPLFLGNLESLTNFTIGGNPLHPGVIPRELGNLKKLQELGLDNCSRVGGVPPFLGNLTQLRSLDISQNLLSGVIPLSLGNLTRLKLLWLWQNNLSGGIPTSLGNLSQLEELDISSNHLRGEIPKEIISLKNLSELNLGHNMLTGEIPALFPSDMTSLDLSDNVLSGGVPPELGVSNIYVFNVSNNHISGRILDGLDNPAYKDSFLGNPGLCGGRNLMLPSCSSDQHNLPPRSLATLLSICLVVLVVALCSVCLYRSLYYKKPKSTPLWKVTPFHSTSVNERYIFPNLKESNVIGSGSAGKVYKVHLQNGEAVAVKKVRNISRSVGNLNRKSDEKESKMGEGEVNILGHIRHRNILKLLCCISSEEADFKLLVYEFMPNGSFFDRLHRQGAGQGMAGECQIRYQIALGAARGLSYMHHDCCPPILHGDVKSSNILLDEEFGAKIADFSVSRVPQRLGKAHSVSGYKGSHGYIAPEYAERLKVNEKSDVYSFGVVLLELVTGMKATGEVEYGEDGNIVDWVCNTIHMGGEKMKVLDERTVEDNCVEQMLRVLHMGLLCTNSVPNQRPSMREMLERLEACGGHSREERVLGLERISSCHSESENEIVCFPDQQS